MNFATVILTTEGRGTPHLAALQAHNPGVLPYVYEGPETGEQGWRNCDRLVRDFWVEMGAEVDEDAVLFLEWDVAVLAALDDIFQRRPGGRIGCVCAMRKSPVVDRRSWPVFGEMDRLPEWIQRTAVGMVPSAVLMASREALDAVADEQFDDVFAADILSELRLGSCMRAAGYEVVVEPNLRHVGTIPLVLPTSAAGIFHPVKP